MADSSSLSQKILGFFVKEAEPGAAQPPARPAAAGTAQSAAPAPAPSGAPDARFAEHLAQVLAKNNPPGPDYFEFREALRGLSSLGLTEEKQFQAAWASFKAMGGPVDVVVLTNTAVQYLNALTADREAFTKSVADAIAERVGGLQQEQQRLRADSEALTRQLAEIQQRLGANTERLKAIDGEVTEQSTKLQQNQQRYEATYAHFAQQIKDEVAKIRQYLA